MAIKFQTNVSRRLRFPYGDFLEVDGQYGRQLLYTVEEEGNRGRLYATPALHEQLQGVGMEPSVEVVVTKVELDGNRKGWDVRRAEMEEKGIEIRSSVEAADVAEDPIGLDVLTQCMEVSLVMSLGAWKRLEKEVTFTSEDVRAVGITLFLERCRRGGWPVPQRAAASTHSVHGGAHA